MTTRWRPPHFRTSNDWSSPHAASNSSAHSPLVTSKLKVRSCDVWNQDQELQYHKTAHWCIPGFFYFLTNFHFQLNWSCSFVKWPSYWWVCHCLGLHSSFFVLFWKPHIQTVLSVPLAFHVSDQLDQYGYCLLISTAIYWHSRSHPTFCHSLQLEQLKWWIFHLQIFWNIHFFSAEIWRRRV